MPSHGSLTKAGRVIKSRDWRIEDKKYEKGIKRWHKKKHYSPKLNNRKKYNRYLQKLIHVHKQVKI